MTNRPGVYGFVDADGTSTWGPHLRRAVFGFDCLGLWVAVFTATGDLSDGWGAFFPDTTSVMVFLAVALAVGIPTWISWSAHRRFCSSRLIPDRTPRPGETLGAVLETGERLAHARDVRRCRCPRTAGPRSRGRAGGSRSWRRRSSWVRA